jgi:hypothetical protein
VHLAEAGLSHPVHTFRAGVFVPAGRRDERVEACQQALCRAAARSLRLA